MPPGKLPAGVLHLVHIGGQNAHRYRQEITERRHFIREMDTPAFQGLIGKPCCYQTIYISPQGIRLGCPGRRKVIEGARHNGIRGFVPWIH